MLPERLRLAISTLAAAVWLAACASLAISAPGQRAASFPEASPSAQIGAQTGDPIAERSATLYIFAAASLTEAFEAITRTFEDSHPGTRVVLNFAGSQQLAQQIIQGAPADVFASANQKQIDAVIADGRIAPGAAQSFAQNQLVVIVPKDNPAQITRLQDLSSADLRLVLAAKEVPVGKYSIEFLDKASRDANYDLAYKAAVLTNVVSYEDNVKAVLSKVALGEADAGIIYLSDISADNAAWILQIEIPKDLNVIATYPIAPVQDSANGELAAAFIALVLSAEGQSSLANYGFIPVK
jgi:molybdate transport system substrate-binding protein